MEMGTITPRARRPVVWGHLRSHLMGQDLRRSHTPFLDLDVRHFHRPLLLGLDDLLPELVDWTLRGPLELVDLPL